MQTNKLIIYSSEIIFLKFVFQCNYSGAAVVTGSLALLYLKTLKTISKIKNYKKIERNYS